MVKRPAFPRLGASLRPSPSSAPFGADGEGGSILGLALNIAFLALWLVASLS